MVDTYEKELKYTLVKEGGLTPKMHGIEHTFSIWHFKNFYREISEEGVPYLYSTSHYIFNVEWSGSSCLYCDFYFINV